MQVKKGDKVSLNSSKRLFFFQGTQGINLIAGQEETAVIPEDIGEGMLRQIGRAIYLGELVAGRPPEKKIPIPNEDSWGDILKDGRNKVLDFVHQFKQDRSIGNEEKIAKLEKLIELERADKDRVSVIKNIDTALSNLAGASPVIEEIGDVVKIEFTKGTE